MSSKPSDIKVYNIEDRRRRPQPERPLSETLNDAKVKFKDFVETRIAMLRSETKDIIAQVKFAAPLLVVGAIFGVTAWLALSAALAALIAVAFRPSPYAAFLGLLIVGVAEAIIAAIALWMGYGRLKANSLMPERTLNVLKQDKVWLENEMRTQS
jgi:hypothetical protein